MVTIPRRQRVTEIIGSDVTNNGTNDGTNKLTERQRLILSMIANDVTINVTNLAQKNHVATRTIKRDLAHLQAIGILKRLDGQRKGYWEISAKNINNVK